VGVFTEQRGEVGARGDSRSREVRLKDGGSRSREKGVENTDFSTEQGERSREHGFFNGAGRKE